MLAGLLVRVCGSPRGPAKRWRLLIPGPYLQPWVYRFIPWSWWSQIGAFETFMECENKKSAIRMAQNSGPISLWGV